MALDPDRISRRRFLELCAAAPIVASRPFGRRTRISPVSRAALGFADPRRRLRGDSSVSAAIRTGFQLRPGEPRRPDGGLRSGDVLRGPQHALDYLRLSFPDFQRHFIFEYYPWYGANPFRHWDDRGLDPPVDIAARSVPLLGAYDSRDAATLERHAKWMVDVGVGAINVSWWGRDSYEDRAVPLLMDVMRAYGIQVTFHLEPYADDRGARYISDILYLLKEYGERRRWDAFLLLRNADGRVGPVFKSFATILPREVTDCHGVVHRVPNYTADGDWRRQTDSIRNELRGEFDHVTLLADTLDSSRALASGFDGIAIYDNYVEPSTWRFYAERLVSGNLVFSFNVNPGFDGITPRVIDPGSCYRALPFEPSAGTLDFSDPRDRATAMSLGSERIRESFRTTISLQTDTGLVNRRRGFFLVYVNSFNEWHEGHEYEPMKNYADLTPAERRLGYHNVDDGSYRLRVLKELIGST